MSIEQIQAALRRDKIDGWLFFDHHRRDPLAYSILDLPAHVNATRRWYYFIPANGTPRKLVHRIESGALDSLPGEKTSYASWPDQQSKLAEMLSASARIAMQYSPRCAIPYVSLVDAGTVDLVRSFGVEVVSSADLVQAFEARWTDAQYQQHLAAGKLVDQVRREAFSWIGEKLQSSVPVSEFDVQQFVRNRFTEEKLVTDHGPIVAVNQNISDPHYEPSAERNSPIRAGDLVLIDLWAKLDQPHAVYYDVTWTGFCGTIVPDRIRNVFEIVRDARKAGSDFVISKVAKREQIAGFEVDDQTRNYISKHGFGEQFFHRTGHSIGTEVHGTGANMDNLESHDERQILSRTCFSVEPGIYLPDFGIRSEVNVYVGEGFATVTGEQQQELVRI
ncbi:MAG TPA: M24 family metallopeptidase [Bryobacteraceae bacterium]|jgi:Xaa-Pro aminopeptidase|nr:M24 family metallopeptidase [Bryobacteraceae bacterium]